MTFHQLVEETRRELAHHYRRHGSVELNEAAFLLGYEDANSFFRAFQGWEGTSPRGVAHAASVRRGRRRRRPPVFSSSPANKLTS